MLRMTKYRTTLSSIAGTRIHPTRVDQEVRVLTIDPVAQLAWIEFPDTLRAWVPGINLVEHWGQVAFDA